MGVSLVMRRWQRALGLGAVLLVVLGLVGWAVSARLRARGADATVLMIDVADFAPGTVRLDQGVWVARQAGGEFFVFLDRDPHRGQRLNWVEAQGLFMQAAAYRADGSCVEGPCVAAPGQGLFRVEARVEGDTLFVHPGRVISGGRNPEPAWLTELRWRLRPSEPAAPAPGRSENPGRP